MAGTLPSIPLSQQFDIDGTLLAGAQLYFFATGTVATPQNSFSDFGLTLENPNPLTADQYGRIPMFWLADGTVHVRLTDASGVVIFDYPTMQVLGPSSGDEGGGGSIDPTTIASTGDVKFRATAETLTGWVKANATSIGSASSGASQRANADTQNLYVYLWGEFTNAHCPVAGGRGANGAADFAANKAIQLPDWRGLTLTGLDGMGNSLAGRILGSNVTSGGGDGANTSAASGGQANHTLTLAEAPTGQISLNDPGHEHPFPELQAGTGWPYAGTFTNTVGIGTGTTGAATTGASLTDHAGGGAHNNMSPFVLGTIYLKL